MRAICVAMGPAQHEFIVAQLVTQTQRQIQVRTWLHITACYSYHDMISYIDMMSCGDFCGSVALWLCGNEAMWLCGYVAMRLVAMRLHCGNTGIHFELKDLFLYFVHHRALTPFLFSSFMDIQIHKAGALNVAAGAEWLRRGERNRCSSLMERTLCFVRLCFV